MRTPHKLKALIVNLFDAVYLAVCILLCSYSLIEISSVAIKLAAAHAPAAIVEAAR